MTDATPRPSRRSLLRTSALAAAAAPLAGAAFAAEQPNVLSRPQRRFGPGDLDPVTLPDPDVLWLDDGFGKLVLGNAVVERVWTGGEWLEGPAWSSAGRFLVFSDVRANRQLRLLWETGSVSTFREPSFHSNGSIFDHQGRQVACQHFARRVVRYEHDGTARVIADAHEGRPLNSPNDVVSHPDGSLWFTDPVYGTTLAEGRPDDAGGPTNPDGRLDPRIGIETPGPVGPAARGPAGLYRWDPSGRLDRVLDEAALPSPNGLAFSPDHRTLYVTSTGQGPGEPPPPGGDKAVHAFPVEGDRLGKGRVFFDMTIDGTQCGPDGLKADVFGNLWCAVSGPLGLSGVVALGPDGRPLGRIRLPEVCANLAFGGPRRNILYMAATRSIYRLQVNTQSAAPS